MPNCASNPNSQNISGLSFSGIIVETFSLLEEGWIKITNKLTRPKCKKSFASED